ncbi:MAG: hypothetical protein C4320_00665 [Armatimonadota bacterium]
MIFVRVFRTWMLGVPAALLVLLHRASGPGLLRDSDTLGLIQGITERHAPLSWFLGDWPLGNHFYRPLPTLLFELDHFLYGSNSAGFGFTNALLAALGVLALLFFASQVLRPLPALAATWLFAFWTVGQSFGPSGIVTGVALGAILAGIWRRRFGFALALGTAIWAFGDEIGGIIGLENGIVGWLPGRTASTCTLFALLALACYARSLLASHPRLIEIGPLDPPAVSAQCRGT